MGLLLPPRIWQTCRTALVVSLVIALGGCKHERKSSARKTFLPDVSTARSQAQATRLLRSQAKIEFVSGSLALPRDQSMTGMEQALAPLIVTEMPDPSEGKISPHHFGSLFVNQKGQLSVQRDDPVVYVHVMEQTAYDKTSQQVCYAWFVSDHSIASTATVKLRGLRSAIGEDGFPLAWEIFPPALGGDLGLELGRGWFQPWYVSQSLEDEAKERFGTTTLDSRFAIEQTSLAKRTSAIIVNLFNDGPIPMGPYVYQAADGGGISTLHCRCSPLQVGEISETVYYELQPMAALKPMLHRLDSQSRAWLLDPSIPVWFDDP